MEISWGKLFIWIFLIGATIAFMRQFDSTWVWGVVFFFIGGFMFVQFMRWLLDQEGAYW